MDSENNKLRLPEILAPVGGAEMLTAAVRSGADAVYLGGSDFNARIKADGFDGAALREAVRYCHERFVRVYYTFNTLLFDDEMKAAEQALRTASAAGVDAVIVQDLAVVSLLREVCPEMPLHASTQMTIHNLDGARAARRLGFDRVVLAREMSAEEIAAVTRGVDIETEVFVHGAHCMSVSGQCLLSAMIGGRSGNRGMCAQPCRLPFSSDLPHRNIHAKHKGKTKRETFCSQDGASDYALSLKDLSLLEHIEELKDLGVASLKIEGRIKRPEYVAAVVTELRRARAGGQPDMKLLDSVFSRNGFTDGYFKGERGRSMFGIRTKKNVVSAKNVLKEIAATVKDEPGRWPLNMIFTLRTGASASLTVHGEAPKGLLRDYSAETDIWVTVQGPVPETAIKTPLTEERLLASLSKLGGTSYFLNDLTVDLDSGLMLRSADLNEMRRAAVAGIAEKRIALFEQQQKANKRDAVATCRTEDEIRINDTEHIPPQGTTRPKLRIRVREAAQLTPFLREQAAAVIAPPEVALELAGGAGDGYAQTGMTDKRVGDKSITDQWIGDKLIVELPPVVFDDNTEELRKTVESLRARGVRHFTVGNLYAFEMLEKISVVGQENRPLDTLDIQAYRLHGTGRTGNEPAGEIVLHGDSGLNISNALSMHDYLSMGLADVTLSPELSKQRILALGAAKGGASGVTINAALGAVSDGAVRSASDADRGSVPDAAIGGLSRAGIPAYGYLPLMQLRNCPGGPCPQASLSPGASSSPSQDASSSASPGAQLSSPTSEKSTARLCALTDRLGKRFPLTCQDGMQTLHNCVPLYIGDKQAQFRDRPAFFTLYFTTEPPDVCEAVTRSFLAGERLPYETTGGLYFR